jgi:hypothetical protein
MIIALEDIDNRRSGWLFVGSRPRVSSATGVTLIDSERLIACSLRGQRMYLIRYDLARNAHAVASCVATTYQGRDVSTDLVDFNGEDLLVTSNCEHNSMSLYRLLGNQLYHVQDLPIPDSGADFCHGARFVPGAPDIVCATCIRGAKQVYFMSTRSTEIIYQFGHDQWRPHDVCFLDERRMVVIYQKGKPTRKATTLHEAKVTLVRFDLSKKVHDVLGEAFFRETHMDCCRAHAGRLYINNQMQDTVVVCRVVGDQISVEREIPGYSFPHGLDVLPSRNLLAVTNYGDNTITLTPL